MDSQLLANFCIEKLDLRNTKLSNEYYYSSLPLCVIDSVFSIGIRYSTTQNIIERFSNYFNIEQYRNYKSLFPNIEEQYSINDLLNIYTQYDVEYITNKIFQNKNRTSSRNGILKSEAVLEFAKVLQKFNINYYQDLNKVKFSKNFENEIKLIKGQKSGISLLYLFMLAGDENTVKPDRMVERFVQKAIAKKLSVEELVAIFNKTIEILKNNFPNLTLRELDHEIWKFEKSSYV